MKRDLLLILQRVVGVLYLIAGFAKAFPNLENVPQELQNAEQVNTNAWFSSASNWFAAHTTFMLIFVGLAMVALGVVYLWDRYLVKLAVLGNLVMVACFITILHRLDPSIWLIDGIAAILALLIYYRQTRKQTQ